MTKEELEKFGLSSQEAALYLAALELSPAAASLIAKKAGIERTASYPHLASLVQKGLLRISPAKGRTLYEAENPHKIGELLKSKEESFKKILPELLSIYNINGVKPKIRYYEGREGARAIMSNSIQSGVKEIFHLTPAQNMMTVLGEDFARRHIESRVAKKIFMKTLRVREALEKPWEMVSTEKSLLRELRYLPEGFKLEDQIIIYQNTVAIISSATENYGLEIQSQEFADTMRSFFALAWEGAEKYIKY